MSSLSGHVHEAKVGCTHKTHTHTHTTDSIFCWHHAKARILELCRIDLFHILFRAALKTVSMVAAGQALPVDSKH